MDCFKMNFQLVILLAIAACAFAIPIPDEEVSTLQKGSETVEAATSIDELIKSAPSLITIEDGTNTVVGNVTVENVTKLKMDSELGKPTEGKIETTSVADDKIVEVPKSLPVLAGIVPPVSEVRAEPKEGVEIAESKSTASSPDADEVETKSEPKPTAEVPATTESVTGPLEKKEETPVTSPKTETTDSKSPAKPVVAGENKTEDSAVATPDAKKTDKTDAKTHESGKGKHDHSSEDKKSEESAESKESEESNESKKN